MEAAAVIFWSVSITFLILGVVFTVLAVYWRSALEINEKNSSVTTGELLYFYETVKIPHDRTTRKVGSYKENAPDRVPVVKFYAGGKEIIRALERHNPRLSRKDIGKKFRLRYTKKNHVILDDEASLAENREMQTRLTLKLSILAAVNFVLLIATCVMAYVVFTNY